MIGKTFIPLLFREDRGNGLLMQEASGGTEKPMAVSDIRDGFMSLHFSNIVPKWLRTDKIPNN